MKKYNLILLFVFATLFGACSRDTNATTNEINKETLRKKESENIDQLYNQILQMANSKSCTNASEWKITGYGEKPCGGFSGFIAYSNQIDTVIFFKKIAEHKTALINYYKKWGIMSDCALPVAPKEVICVNDKPVLVY